MKGYDLEFAQKIRNKVSTQISFAGGAGNIKDMEELIKKVGVVGISKAENVQLGLILRWVALELDWDTIPNEVLVNPEALTKLIGRYRVEGTIYE